VPPEATIDEPTASATFANPDFVVDVQTHMLDFALERPLGESFFGQNFPQASCGEDDPRVCYDAEHYLDLVLAQSDTTVAVLSALPIAAPNGPLTPEVMAHIRSVTDSLCGAGRLLTHGQANPNIGPLDQALADMAELADAYPISAWKVYTHNPGDGWRFDDADPDGVPCGRAFIEQAISLGIPIICVHKGLGGGSPWASPADIGPAAAAHPEASFVVYHSGFDRDDAEGPYDATTADIGVNRLITSMESAGIGPNENVYAELGTTWFNVLRDPTQAAHTLGKLLSRVGEDNVVWGTDSIWYGSPQGQIDALRAFEISDEFQERFGYPALTSELKAKILGRNAARLYGIDPGTVRCTFTREDLESVLAD